MAMHLGRKLFRQISAGRYVSAGTGGELGSNTGLAGATQTVRRYCHSSNTQSSKNWFLSPETARRLNDALPDINLFTIFLLGLTWFQMRRMERIGQGLRDIAKAREEGLRKFLEESGKDREFCEANIAELKQKAESGPLSKFDRYWLEEYERWLQVLTKGT